MDAEAQSKVTETLAELELLVFGSSCDDEGLVRKFLSADEAFNAHVVARLAREPVTLH
jgi:hypothetical protein